MRRTLWLTIVAVLLIAVSWSAGYAQTRVANFQINIEVPRGEAKVTCSRGCDWPAADGAVMCGTERCRLMFDGHGRITLGQPK